MSRCRASRTVKRYLSSIISNSGGTDKIIENRLKKAKGAFA